MLLNESTVCKSVRLGDSMFRCSMFGSVELDSLNPRMLNHVNIKVVANLEGPFMCVQPSHTPCLHGHTH